MFLEKVIQHEFPRQSGTKNTGVQREDNGSMERLGECPTVLLWSYTESNSAVQNNSNFLSL